MREIPFRWYELQGDMENVPALACSGLEVIPGCEQTAPSQVPASVKFGGKEYRTYSIDPMGAVILGNDPVYMDKLSEDKLFPDTANPVIIPLGEYMQIKG